MSRALIIVVLVILLAGCAQTDPPDAPAADEGPDAMILQDCSGWFVVTRVEMAWAAPRAPPGYAATAADGTPMWGAVDFLVLDCAAVMAGGSDHGPGALAMAGLALDNSTLQEAWYYPVALTLDGAPGVVDWFREHHGAALPGDVRAGMAPDGRSAVSDANNTYAIDGQAPPQDRQPIPFSATIVTDGALLELEPDQSRDPYPAPATVTVDSGALLGAFPGGMDEGPGLSFGVTGDYSFAIEGTPD